MTHAVKKAAGTKPAQNIENSPAPLTQLNQRGHTTSLVFAEGVGYFSVGGRVLVSPFAFWRFFLVL